MENFSHRFEIIYKKFCEQAAKSGGKANKAAFGKFLNASMGKLQKWEQGQVPKPDDLKLLNSLFGFSYKWLVTGEGKMMEEDDPQKIQDESLLQDRKFAELSDAVDRMAKEMKIMRDDIIGLQKRLETGVENSNRIVVAAGQE